MTASFTLLFDHQRIKGHRAPQSFTPKEESGSHCLLFLDKKTPPTGLRLGSTIKILMLADADRGGALKAYKSYFEKQKQEALTNLGKMDSRQRNEYWQTLRPFIADCYRLEDTDAGFLYDVTLFAKGWLLQLDRLSGNSVASQSALKTLAYKWTDIQKRLKQKQATIEFIQYEKDGQNRMAALVLKSTGKPTFVSLTSPDEILSLAGKSMQSTDRTNKDKRGSSKLPWLSLAKQHTHSVAI